MQIFLENPFVHSISFINEKAGTWKSLHFTVAVLEFTVYILLCQCGSVRVYSLHFTVPVWQCWSIKSVWAGQMIDK